MDLSKPMDVRGCVVFLILGTLVMLAAFIVHRTYSYAICSSVEREAMATVPRYDTNRMSPKPNLEAGSCQMNYYVQADKEDVAAYYRTQLKEYGWMRPDSDSIKPPGYWFISHS